MVDLVNAYVRSGQTGQAETFIRSILADNPANAEALVLMGSIQLAKNAPGEAEKLFKTAIEKKPADAVGYRALADLYARQKKIDDAVNVVDVRFADRIRDPPQGGCGLAMPFAGAILHPRTTVLMGGATRAFRPAVTSGLVPLGRAARHGDNFDHVIHQLQETPARGPRCAC